MHFDRDSLVATAFVLVGALLLAIYNVYKGKILKAKEVREDHLLLTNMLGSGILLTASGFFLPFGSHEISGLPAYVSGLSNSLPLWLLALLITGPLNVAIQSLNNAALKREDTSLVTPLASATPILLLFMSWYLLGQWPTNVQRVGLVLIALGAYLLYLKGKKMELPRAISGIVPKSMHETFAHYFGPWLRVANSTGAQLALLSAYIGSISINFDALIATELNPLLGPGLTMIFVGVCTLLYMVYAGNVASLKGNIAWGKLFKVAVVYSISVGLMTAGYLYQIASLAGSLKRSQIFWTVLIATLVMKEAYARDRIIGSVVITIGAILGTAS